METGQAKSKLFFKLLMEHQKKIHTYILMLIPQFDDADEVMQETLSVMWEKFETFQPGTNFGAWGVQIARFQSLKFIKSRRRNKTIFDSDMLDYFQSQEEMIVSGTDDRLKALAICLSKLSEGDRNLIEKHYNQQIAMKTIAESLGRGVFGIYKSFNRIHNLLLNCINKTLKCQEGI